MENVLYAEKRWDSLKSLYENEEEFILKDNKTFEITQENVKEIYELNPDIVKNIERQFNHYHFSCLKRKNRVLEDYNLYFEDEKNMKILHIVYNSLDNNIYVDISSNKKSIMGNISIRIAEEINKEDKQIMETFYKKITEQHYLRLKNVTGSIKRVNLYEG